MKDVAYSGFVSRLIAIFVDPGIVSLLSLILFWVSTKTLLISMSPALTLLIQSGMICILYFIYTIVPLATAGQTLGKSLIGIKVLNYDFSNIGFKAALTRTVAIQIMSLVSLIGIFLSINPESLALKDYYLPSFYSVASLWAFFKIIQGLYFTLEAISFAYDYRSRTVHDLIAGTVVVDINQPVQNESK